jgi:hypothetical protein
MLQVFLTARCRYQGEQKSISEYFIHGSIALKADL